MMMLAILALALGVKVSVTLSPKFTTGFDDVTVPGPVLVALIVKVSGVQIA